MDFNLDELLIEEVRKRPLLYDLGHEDYKDLKKKDKAWKEISRKLKTEEILCKNRWKGLRISYMRCKRTDPVPKTTALGFPKRRWRFCKAMSFLDNVKKSRPTDNSRTFQDVWLEVCDGLDSNDEKYSTDFDLIETLQEAESHSPVIEMIEEIDQKKEIDSTIELATSNISENCVALKQKTKRNSTELLFQSLAAKIREANMPMSVSNQINAKVVALVFSEIQNYQDYVYEANQ